MFCLSHLLILGTHERNSKSREEKGLDEASLASWNVTLHVRAALVELNDLTDVQPQRRLSQLIGSTLALEYMRAGKLVPH